MTLEQDVSSKVTYGSALLVVLGAGASYDALSTNVGTFVRPPLTKDLAGNNALMNTLLHRYPRARPVINVLQKQLATKPGLAATTLEKALADYLGRSAFDPHVSSQITATRFYLRDLLYESATSVSNMNGGINNYTDLVTRCYQWARQQDSMVCFVNFNYDPLLEWACRDVFNLQPHSIGTYDEDPNAKVFKPHGSVLWAWPHPSDLKGHDRADFTLMSINAGEPDVSLMTELVSAEPPPNSQHAATNMSRATLPAFALPMDGKSDFVWPQRQSQYFSDPTLISNGLFGKVMVVGWRAAEPHFMELLPRVIKRQSKLLVVTGGTSEVTTLHDATATAEKFNEYVPIVKYSLRGFSGIEENEWEWLLD
jgi:hypothetical protein